MRGLRGGGGDFDDGDDEDDVIDAGADVESNHIGYRDSTGEVEIERVGGGVPSFCSIIFGDGFGCGDIYYFIFIFYYNF